MITSSEPEGPHAMDWCVGQMPQLSKIREWVTWVHMVRVGWCGVLKGDRWLVCIRLRLIGEFPVRGVLIHCEDTGDGCGDREPGGGENAFPVGPRLIWGRGVDGGVMTLELKGSGVPDPSWEGAADDRRGGGLLKGEGIDSRSRNNA